MPAADRFVPTASVLDTVRTVGTVALPLLARGAVVRRPRVLDVLQRVDADRRAVRQLQRLRARYGPGPVRMRIPVRRFTFLLEPDQVRRVLAESPDRFALDTVEKRGALSHFQPEGVLVSSPDARRHRRPFNEAVLDADRPLHRFAEVITVQVEQEAENLLRQSERTGTLTWDDFARSWWRTVRRVVLGDSARDDDAVTDLLLSLRRRANFSYAMPKRAEDRRRFDAMLRDYVQRAEPGSLAGLAAATPADPETDRAQQIPQWLFASDAVAWSGFRALALLSTHPEAVTRARADRSPDLPFLRACLLESLRLWPTTPAILRDSIVETRWPTGILPAGTPVMLFAPFFHRDDTRLPEAHRFAPELWLRERTDDDWPLVPFSGGPGECPGRNLVLLMGSVLLATLVRSHDIALTGDALRPDRPLPGMLSPFRLRFEVRRRPPV